MEDTLVMNQSVINSGTAIYVNICNKTEFLLDD
jgi:hypothetical protein